MSKRINLALLVDGPNKKQTTESKFSRPTSNYTPKSNYVPKVKPVAEQSHQMVHSSATDFENQQTGSPYSALAGPCFPLIDIPDISVIPRFESVDEVKAFCKIPQLLLEIHPCTLLKCNSRSDLFPGITFDEEPHEYWLAEEVFNKITGNTNSVNPRQRFHKFNGSVTVMAGKCFSPFDQQASINSVLGSSNYNSPDYDYYQMTPTQISCQYLAGNMLGTLLHYLIELFFNGYGSCIPPQLKDKAWLQFELFYVTEIRNKYKVLFTEFRVYDFEHDLAGSIDGVFVSLPEWEASQRENRPPVLTLFDWKRTKHFHEKSFRGEMAMAPLQHMADANVPKYFCQVNIYKKVIERNSPFKVGGMNLVRFHPNSPTYEMKPIPVLEKETNDLFALRKAEMELKAAKV